MSAELNVQLRLLLDQVQGDAAKAAAIIKQQLGASLSQGISGGGASPVSKQTQDVERLTRQVQKGTVGFHALGKELKNLGQGGGGNLGGLAKLPEALRQKVFAQHPELQKEWESKTNKASGILGSPASKESLSEKAAKKAAKDLLTFQKDMSFLMMPLFSPGSIWATLFSSRQTFSAMNTEHGAAFRGKYMGGMGAAGATGVLVAAATAAGLALEGLKKVIQETMAAYEKARLLYAKSLMSGLGLGMTTRMSMMSSIIGVSESDVLRFGAAMAYLNPKLEFAAAQIQKSTMPLTSVSWEFHVMGENLHALWSQIAESVSPSIQAFAENLNEFFVELGKSELLHGVGESLNAIFILLNDVVGIAEVAFNLIAVAFLDVAYVIVKTITSIVNGILKIPGVSKLLGIKSLNTSEMDKMVLDANVGLKNQAQKVWDNSLGGKTGGQGSPQAWMKQLPASSWEKMGLVIGGSGANYAKDTARNTAETAKAVKAMAAHMGIGVGRGTSIYSPAFAMP